MNNEPPVVRIRDRPPIDKLQEMMQGRPYVAQIVQMQLLYDLCSMTEDLLTVMKETVPEGKMFSREYTITGRPLEIDSKTENTLPWRGAEITNLGPNILFVALNRNTAEVDAGLGRGEKQTIDFRAPKILKLILWVESGEALVKVVAFK